MNPDFLKYWGRRPDYARYYSGAAGASSSFLNRQGGVSASFASPVRSKVGGGGGGGNVILTNVPGNAMINLRCELNCNKLLLLLFYRTAIALHLFLYNFVMYYFLMIINDYNTNSMLDLISLYPLL